MSDLNLRLEGMLSFIDMNGANGFDDSKVEELESLLYECNGYMNDAVNYGTNTDMVADSIYDTLYDMLKQVKPESKVLSEIWNDGEEGETVEGGGEDYTKLLRSNPMMSIETAKSYDCKELKDFIERMPNGVNSYFASYKINGHGIRVVYEDGFLVSATSRARASAGRDITRHMKVILGEYNAELADYGLVELRGELALPMANLAAAREFNPTIKSAFSAVASMVRPSATDEEISLLDFLCYGLIVEDFIFTDREEEFQEIERVGYKTPSYMYVEEAEKEDLLELIHDFVKTFEDGYEEFGYFCDGVVFEINDREIFQSLGTNGKYNLGNIALKVGVWEQVQYSGYVQKILWTRGKSKLSPVAIVADEPNKIWEDSEGNILNWDDMGIITAQGNRAKRVPLYEPKNILLLSAYPGELIFFRYGSEAGVIPCFADGRLLSEDVSKEALSGELELYKE